MGVYKRTEITVETNEVLIVRRARVYRGWCPLCAQEVDMVGVPEARAMAGMPVDGAGSTKSAKWHISEEQETALVCLESVLKSI